MGYMNGTARFGETLSQLILEFGITNRELAKAIGVSEPTVCRWRALSDGVGLRNLVALCRYFKCSLEYLAGRTESDIKPTSFTIENFGAQLRKFMKEKSISTYKFRKDTGLGGRILYDWDRGSDPKLSTLIELATYFNCSLDELVGLE